MARSADKGAEPTLGAEGDSQLLQERLSQLGEEIKEAREARRIPRRQLVEKCRPYISLSYLSLLERARAPVGETLAGKKRENAPRPSPTRLRVIAEALGADANRWLQLAGYGEPQIREPAREKPNLVRDLEGAERGHLDRLVSKDRPVVEIPPLAALTIHPHIGGQGPLDFRIVGVSLRARKDTSSFLFLDKRLTYEAAEEKYEAAIEPNASKEEVDRYRGLSALPADGGSRFSFRDAKRTAIGTWGRYSAQTALLLSAVQADGRPWCLLGWRRVVDKVSPLYDDKYEGHPVHLPGHFSDGLDVLACGNIVENGDKLKEAIKAKRLDPKISRDPKKLLFEEIEPALAKSDQPLLRIYVHYAMGGLYGELRRERLQGIAIPNYPYAIERDDFRTLTRQYTAVEGGNRRYLGENWPLALLVAPAVPLDPDADTTYLPDSVAEITREDITRALLTFDSDARETQEWHDDRINEFNNQSKAKQELDHVGQALGETLVGETQDKPWVQDDQARDDLARELSLILEHGASLRPDPMSIEVKGSTAPLYVPPKLPSLEDLTRIIATQQKTLPATPEDVDFERNGGPK